MEKVCLKDIKLIEGEESALQDVHAEIQKEKEEASKIETVLYYLDNLIQRAYALTEDIDLDLKELLRLTKEHSITRKAGKPASSAFKDEFQGTLEKVEEGQKQLMDVYEILSQYYESLDKDERVQKTLLAKISHELKNMMQGITKISSELTPIKGVVIESDFKLHIEPKNKKKTKHSKK